MESEVVQVVWKHCSLVQFLLGIPLCVGLTKVYSMLFPNVIFFLNLSDYVRFMKQVITPYYIL